MEIILTEEVIKDSAQRLKDVAYRVDLKRILLRNGFKSEEINTMETWVLEMLSLRYRV